MCSVWLILGGVWGVMFVFVRLELFALGFGFLVILDCILLIFKRFVSSWFVILFVITSAWDFVFVIWV